MEPGSQNSEGKFVALVNENQLKILKVCHVYAWNREDQQDLYQEILFQIWRSLPKLREAAYSNTWLYRVALSLISAFQQTYPFGSKLFRLSCNNSSSRCD